MLFPWLEKLAFLAKLELDITRSRVISFFVFPRKRYYLCQQ
jgi:hypothetical protein